MLLPAPSAALSPTLAHTNRSTPQALTPVCCPFTACAAGSTAFLPAPLQDIKGQVYPFCRDQHGSRLVQQQLEAADPATLAGAPPWDGIAWLLLPARVLVRCGCGADGPLPGLAPTCLILPAIRPELTNCTKRGCPPHKHATHPCLPLPPPPPAELFGEVRHKLLPLMVDVFGNYGERLSAGIAAFLTFDRPVAPGTLACCSQCCDAATPCVNAVHPPRCCATALLLLNCPACCPAASPYPLLAPPCPPPPACPAHLPLPCLPCLAVP